MKLLTDIVLFNAPVIWALIFFPLAHRYSARCAKRERGYNLERES